MGRCVCVGGGHCANADGPLSFSVLMGLDGSGNITLAEGLEDVDVNFKRRRRDGQLVSSWWFQTACGTTRQGIRATGVEKWEARGRRVGRR